MSGNIATCTSQTLTDFLKIDSSYDKRHIFVNENCLNEGIESFLSSHGFDFKCKYSGDFYYFNST